MGLLGAVSSELFPSRFHNISGEHTRAAMWSARWPPVYLPWAVRGCCGDLNAAATHCAKRTTSCSIFVIKSLSD